FISLLLSSTFFFNATPTTEIYTLSLHDALPIYIRIAQQNRALQRRIRVEQRLLLLQGEHVRDGTIELGADRREVLVAEFAGQTRSEEHTSELQSRGHLVCRLLLEKKKKRGEQTS